MPRTPRTFAIGSGTKLALEDAIELTNQFKQHGTTRDTIPAVLKAYEEVRRVDVARIQNAARNAMEWFEVVGARYADTLEPEQFMYSLLTRSQRISHENLRLRDKAWLEGYERWFAERSGVPASNDRVTPPMFTPFRHPRPGARPTASSSRRWRCTRREDGVPNDFHLVHFSSRALGGAGLVITEMTCVSPEARITPGCCGLWNDEQAAAYNADRRLRARQLASQDRHPARPCRPQGLDPRRLGGHGRSRCRTTTGRWCRPRRCLTWLTARCRSR